MRQKEHKHTKATPPDSPFGPDGPDVLGVSDLERIPDETDARALLTQCLGVMGRDIQRITAEPAVNTDDAQRVGYYTRTLIDVIRRTPRQEEEDEDLDALMERIKNMPHLADALRSKLEEAA